MKKKNQEMMDGHDILRMVFKEVNALQNIVMDQSKKIQDLHERVEELEGTGESDKDYSSVSLKSMPNNEFQKLTKDLVQDFNDNSEDVEEDLEQNKVVIDMMNAFDSMINTSN